MTGRVTFWQQLRPETEIKIREDAFANHCAAFKHRLSNAAVKIGMIFCLAFELGLVRVDYENVFSRIAVAGKNFPKKLFTYSHNSQNNGNPFDKQLVIQRAKSAFPLSKTKNCQ